MARHAGGAAAEGDSFEDLSEFASVEGEEELARCRVQGTMARSVRRQVFVLDTSELQSSSIGCVGDEDVGVDEVT